MAKLSKEELKNKVSESNIAEDVMISLLEDIEDSFEEVDASLNEELQAKYDELVAKYKERFLSGPEEKKEEPKEESLTEENVIDITEI